MCFIKYLVYHNQFQKETRMISCNRQKMDLVGGGGGRDLKNPEISFDIYTSTVRANKPLNQNTLSFISFNKVYGKTMR